jgi:hypothetical protein
MSGKFDENQLIKIFEDAGSNPRCKIGTIGGDVYNMFIVNEREEQKRVK